MNQTVFGSTSLGSGAHLKRAGQQLALDMAGSWKEDVLTELRAWILAQQGQGAATMTFEQFRATARNHPGSHKAWGALPKLACQAGLIAPLTHPDGSPVMKAAESEKTHGHHVRVWALIASFCAPVDQADKPPRIIEQQSDDQCRHPVGIAAVGDGLPTVGSSTDSLLAATAAFNRVRSLEVR